MRCAALAMFAASALLAGCDDPVKTVRGWFGGSPAVVASPNGTPRDCPDLRGNYSLTTPVNPVGQFDLVGTFLGGGIGQVPGNPWQTVSIEGNADAALQLTYSRTAASGGKADSARRDGPARDKQLPAYIQFALETDYSKPLDRKTVSVTRGAHYECKNGRLLAVGSGTTRFWRDGADLAAELTVRTARVFSLWAETGAGIPYWFDDKTRLARYPSQRAADAAAAAKVPLPALAREEYEQTYGKPAAAAAAEAAAAAAAAAALPAPGSVPQPTPRAAPPAYDINAEVRALVDRNATVENIAFDNGRYVLTLRVESSAPVGRTIENLRGNVFIEDVQDHGTISGGNRAALATLSMRINPPR